MKHTVTYCKGHVFVDGEWKFNEAEIEEEIDFYLEALRVKREPTDKPVKVMVTITLETDETDL